MDGILLINKLSGMTSHDVVDYVRKKTGIKKIGHTGTLDPNATGLLILCIGKATRLSEFFISMDKTYEGKMRLGVVSDSHDIDGNILEENQIPADMTEEVLKKYCSEFVGEIEQIPPMVSAIKMGGKRLYKMAREGLSIERPPRKIKVYEFFILKVDLPYVWIRVSCSRGTYVRTLCHDLGKRIGCGAILTELTRIRIGNFTLNNTIPLESITSKEDIAKHIIPISEALDLPYVIVSKHGENIFCNGGKILREEIQELREGTIEWVKVFNEENKFLGLATIQKTAAGPYIVPRRVFC